MSGLHVTLACLLLACSAACGSTRPSRFYLVTPVSEAGADAGFTVRLGPVELPRYLAVSQIVTRSGSNALELAEFDRWGESLGDNVARVVAENLTALLPPEPVAQALWERPAGADYFVSIAVQRFDAEAGSVVLRARWTVSSVRPEGFLFIRRAEFVRPVDGGGYGEVAAAMSRVLSDLCVAIANSLRAQHEEAPPGGTG